jgi:hypothetical protein
MSRSRSLVAAAILAAVLTAGCGATREGPGSPFDGTREANDVLLTVQNNDFRDATIHVIWSGMKTRAGMVTGKTSETFRMDWRSEWARLEVDFIGDRGGYETETVGVNPGDHLNFVIMPGR